jgi:hypothetical protein
MIKAKPTRPAYLPNAHGNRHAVQLLIYGDQEAGVHGGDEEIHHPVVLVEDDYSLQQLSQLKNTTEEAQTHSASRR